MGALCFGVSKDGELELDLDVAAEENRAFMLTRTHERQEMVILNDRLTVYIEKVIYSPTIFCFCVYNKT